MLQVTFTQAVKVWKAENIVLQRNVQGRRAGYSWCPLLGYIIIDISGFINRGTLDEGDKVCSLQVDVSAIVHTHTSRAIVYDEDSLVHICDGM
ncbi:hypothetical protein KR067_002982 [Drosophila pandora]|nr:hypothetical protein KR067_002982 [Drosophila pandora]